MIECEHCHDTQFDLIHCAPGDWCVRCQNCGWMACPDCDHGKQLGLRLHEEG